jgi:cob(I)alamin adenosyltransferase
LLHTARVITRRAERSVWALLEVDARRTNALTARYLNRLSDLLFILARVANPAGDVLWAPGERPLTRPAAPPAGPTPARTENP